MLHHGLCRQREATWKAEAEMADSQWEQFYAYLSKLNMRELH